MKNETMLNAMKSQKQKMEEQFKDWEIREKERLERIYWCINAPINKDKAIFLYESSPCDDWDEWNDVCIHAANVYKEEMELGSKSKNGNPWKQIVSLEHLMVNGLIHFADVFNQELRGECLKYCFAFTKPNEGEIQSEEPVISLKVDTNGTCYAWSYRHDLNIPHDIDVEWKLYDARRLQTMIK